MNLKFEKQTYIVVDYSDLEKLIRKTYNRPHYDILGEEEWGNDSAHSFNIKKTNHSKWGVDSIKNWDSPALWALMEDMANRDIIEEGNYLVEVCW
jgi:hypothetical protein